MSEGTRNRPVASGSRPRLFIGSSTEGLKYAKALGEHLAEHFTVKLWSDNVFQVMKSGLDALLEESTKSEFAVFVLTADDVNISRNNRASVARDNVLFELGMFLGRLGTDRVFFVAPERVGIKFKLPTDLAGITELRFVANGRYRQSMRTTADKILEQLEDFPLRPTASEEHQQERTEHVLRHYLTRIRRESPLDRDLGIHLFLIRGSGPGATLIRVARERSDPAAPTRWEFEHGVGVAGSCWAQNGDVLLDLTSPALTAATTKTLWAAVPEAQRFGMDWKLFQETRKRYKFISAVPVRDPFDPHAEFLGCITLNLGSTSSSRLTSFRNETVQSHLRHASEALGMLVGGRQR